MPLSVSQKFKTNALSKSGNYPAAKVTVYDVSGSVGRGKGLSREIIDGNPLGEKIWPATGAKDYSQQICFNFGDSPPLGITEYMLTDRMTYSILWNGFFFCGRPAGVTGVVNYKFAYVSTGYSFLTVDGDLICQCSSANQLKEIEESDWIGLTYEKWIPLQCIFSRMGASNRRIQKDKFILFWKDDLDDQYRVVGSDVTSPQLMSHKNVTNTPISSIEATSDYAFNTVYLLTIHSVGGVYHFHAGESPTEYAVTPGATQAYDINGDLVTIAWSSSIYANDQAYIYCDGFDHGWDLPGVNNISIECTNEAASVLTFNVPVTTIVFDEDNVTRNNAYTYVTDNGDYGVLRKNRLIEASLGYVVNGSEELVKKFTGFIQDIKPSHKSSSDGGSVMMLDVTCMDARVSMVGTPITKIENIPMGPLPDTLCYDLIQRFATADGIGCDGKIRPPAYDGWKLTDVIRTVGYQNNMTSSQLWAKDEHDNYLIDDRELYLERSPSYPYTFSTQYGTRSEAKSYKVSGREYAGGYGNLVVEQPQETGRLLRRYNITKWLANRGWRAALEKISYNEYYGSVQEDAYLYPFPFDGDPYELLQTIVADFGLKVGVNTDGNVYLKYPNNPKIYNTHADDTDTDYIEYTAAWEKTPESYLTSIMASEQQPIRCFMHTLSEAGTATVHFQGVGLRVIFALPKTASTATVDIDSVRVDGVNVLDTTTGDIGHREWIDNVDVNGVVDLSSGAFYDGDEDYWYNCMGNNQLMGYNPTMFTICNNLTYGDHVAEINWNTGTVAIEGFAVIANAVDVPVHIFDSTVDISDVDYDDSLDSMTNDVTIIGNMTGAENDYVQARATDLASIVDPSSPNYIGVRRPWTIITPKVNQHMAEFLAQHLLLAYCRGKRFPSVNTTGLTWLYPDDCIAIDDSGIGMYSELAAIDWRWALYFIRYWITSTKESYSKGEDGAVQYTMSLEMTSFQPLPAYEMVPEPSKTDYFYPLVNADVNIDDSAATYNPYLEDYSGKYVNIEYGLAWNARKLAVRVVTAQSLKLFGEKKLPTTPVNILTAQSGFVPAGKYINRWDGWIVNTDGKGLYAPDGHYAIEWEIEKYDTGETFYFRSDAGVHAVLKSVTPETIEIVQDSSVYGTSRYAVTTTPFGTKDSPAAFYNDENSGHGLQYDVTLACPAKIMLGGMVRHLFAHGTLPANTDTGFFKPTEMWAFTIPGEEEAPLLDSGDYTFYFNPMNMLSRSGGIVPFGDLGILKYDDIQTQDWWVCWHIIFNLFFIDKAGNKEMVGPSYPDYPDSYGVVWGGDSALYGDPSDIVTRHDSEYTYIFHRFRKII